MTMEILLILKTINHYENSDYDYDADNRLTHLTYTGSNNYTSQGYRSGVLNYDHAGNRNWINKTTSSGAQTENFDSNGQAPNTHYSTDERGNIITRASSSISSQKLRSFNAFDQLSTITKNNVVTNYAYNVNNQRVLKRNNSGDRHFVYHPHSEVPLAEYVNGSLDKEYIYLGSRLVAIRKNGAFYNVYADHLGRPQAAYNQSNGLVWRARNFAFDRKVVYQHSSFSNMNIGFPGQYYDVENGLWYNWHRYYDPKTGRYISVDPIGILGGTNSYVYVDGNPVRWSDPEGLTKLVHNVSDGTLTVYPEAEGGESYVIDVTSGRGDCENDTSCEFKQNEGPLPRGDYYIQNKEIDNPSFKDDFTRNFRTPREQGGGDWGD